MNPRNSKEIADALAAMAAGKQEPPKTTQAAKPRPSAPPRPADKPAPISRAVPPPAPAPVIKAAKPRPAPVRAAAPGLSASTAAARPAAPTAGADAGALIPAAPAAEDAELSSRYADAVLNMPQVDPALAARAADDRAVIAPAPSPESFRARGRNPKDPLAGRRTMIPLLLTTGVIMLLIACLGLKGGSMLGDSGPWVPIALIACGLVLLGLAAANMLYVKRALETAAEAAGPTR